jgi:hypothetical protein
VFSPETVLAKPGRLGITIETDASGKNRKVPWRIEAILTEVRPSGRPVQGVGIRTQIRRDIEISSGKPLDLLFPVSSRPAFYRVDSYFFSSKSNMMLAHYAEYFRVVKRIVRLRLKLKKHSYFPGETVLVRLDNLGSVALSYEYAYSLERYVDGQWTDDPLTPKYTPAVLKGVGAGRATRCDSIHLPEIFPAGRYRVSKDIGIWPNGRLSRHARAAFIVK